MIEEYILRIFWKRANEHKNELSVISRRDFGVEIHSDITTLMDVIEKLIDAFPIIKQSSFPSMKLDNIIYHIEQQVLKTKEELKKKGVVII